MRVLSAICATHMRLAWRGGHSGLAVAFLFIAVTLLPFGLGPELKLLRALAPGLLWVVLDDDRAGLARPPVSRGF